MGTKNNKQHFKFSKLNELPNESKRDKCILIILRSGSMSLMHYIFHPKITHRRLVHGRIVINHLATILWLIQATSQEMEEFYEFLQLSISENPNFINNIELFDPLINETSGQLDVVEPDLITGNF